MNTDDILNFDMALPAKQLNAIILNALVELEKEPATPFLPADLYVQMVSDRVKSEIWVHSANDIVLEKWLQVAVDQAYMHLVSKVVNFLLEAIKDDEVIRAGGRDQIINCVCTEVENQVFDYCPSQHHLLAWLAMAAYMTAKELDAWEQP